MNGRLEEANRLVNLGDLDRAEALIKEVLQQGEALAQALTLSGVIAQLRGDSAAAIVQMNQALAVDPNNPVAFVTSGQAYRALGDLRAAEDCLRQALKLDPGRHDAHLNLALTLWAAGEHARAGTYFKNVLLLTEHSFQAYFYLGQMHQENGEFPQAEEHFRKALSLQPAHVEAGLLLGGILLAQGRIPDASQALERAVVANPGEARVLVAAARAAFELGNESRALEHLQIAFADKGADGGSTPTQAASARACQFDLWCHEQQVELVRVAKQQSHKVRPVSMLPDGGQVPDISEPNTPDVLVAALSQCRVLPGDHMLLSRDGVLCISGVMTRPLHRLFTSPNLVHCADDGRLLLKLAGRQQRITTPCAYLGAADSFFDWVFECVTRLWAYQQRPAGKDLPLLVQAGLTRWQLDLLGLLGYGEGRLIHASEDTTMLCDELLVASLSAPLNFVAPFALEFLRRGLRRNAAPPSNGSRRLFLSRQEMSGRRLANYPEIAAILEQQGFQTIPADFSYTPETLEMLQSAELIVGVEGAAMTNAFLAPAHARIAMITADVARTIRYSGPSRALGQEFTFLQGEAVFDSHAQLSECDIRLDPRMLRTYLGKSRSD